MSIRQNMNQQIHADPKSTHGRDDGEPHEVFRALFGRKEIGAVDLRQVAHRVDEG